MPGGRIGLRRDQYEESIGSVLAECLVLPLVVALQETRTDE